MKSNVLANSLIAACVLLLAWWFLRPAAPAPAPATATVANDHPAQSPPTDTSPPPDLPPEPPPIAADALAAAATTLAAQAELGSMMQAAGKLIEAGDYYTLLRARVPAATWDQMSDDEKAALTQQLQTRAQDPQVQQTYNAMIGAMQATTPTIDATGTVATYTLPPGSYRTTVVMTKLNGRWVDLLSSR